MKDQIIFAEKSVSCVVVSGAGNEVLAVITPKEIIEKDGYRVVLID